MVLLSTDMTEETFGVEVKKSEKFYNLICYLLKIAMKKLQKMPNSKSHIVLKACLNSFRCEKVVFHDFNTE